MPQGRRKAAPKTTPLTAAQREYLSIEGDDERENLEDLTISERRALRVHEEALEAVGDYSPRDDEFFEPTRGYVEAQLGIAAAVQSRYDAVLAERKRSRETLRNLFADGFLTSEEAVYAFELYPNRERKSDGAEVEADDETTTPAPEPVAAA